MGASLTRQIADAHRFARERSGGGADESWALRCDHVAADQEAAPLLLAALASLGGARARAEAAVVCLEGSAARPGFAFTSRLRTLVSATGRHGMLLARPGSGACDVVCRERFAAPGRLIATAGRGDSSSGALGALALGVSAVEAAVAAAGAALHVARPRVLAVRLRGAPPPAVGGHDLALEVLRRLARAGAPDAVVEFGGPGVAALPMTDRVALASRVGTHALAAVLPSDEVTREYLRAQGREADWKPAAAEADASFDAGWEIDLDALEPVIAPGDELDAPRPVRHLLGMGVGLILIGTGATAADLARLARVLAGRSVRHGVRLAIVPGSRRVFEAAEASGALAALAAAGATILDRESAAIRAADASTCALHCGARLDRMSGLGIEWHAASPATCAAAALAGCVGDPRELGRDDRDADGAEAAAARDALLRPHAPAAGGGTDPEQGLRPLPPGRPLGSALRGPVLIRLADRATSDDLLPRGPRVDPATRDVMELCGHVLSAVDPGFARRARLHGGGYVLACREAGGGGGAELAAQALAALGVRAFLARAFDAGFRRCLVRAGALPLRLRTDGDAAGIAAGDELEIPGLPEALEAGKPLVVRNLTRGTQHAVAHDLDALGMAIVRAGGLLAHAVAEIAGRDAAAAAGGD